MQHPLWQVDGLFIWILTPGQRKTSSNLLKAVQGPSQTLWGANTLQPLWEVGELLRCPVGWVYPQLVEYHIISFPLSHSFNDLSINHLFQLNRTGVCFNITAKDYFCPTGAMYSQKMWYFAHAFLIFIVFFLHRCSWSLLYGIFDIQNRKKKKKQYFSQSKRKICGFA